MDTSQPYSRKRNVRFDANKNCLKDNQLANYFSDITNESTFKQKLNTKRLFFCRYSIK